MSDYILCPRAKDVPLDDMEDGTTKTVCSKCGENVWIGPNGADFQEKTGLPVICVPCLRKHWQGNMPPHVQAFMTGMQTLLNAIGKFFQDAGEASEKATEKRRKEISRN